ncbi:MAG: HAMP domain-containing sensor histidine kinase, partial [Chromatocurvus sp.]
RLTGRLAHMEGLVNSMLSFLRGGKAEVQQLNLQDVLADLAAVVQATVRDADVDLRITPVDRSLVLRGCRDDLVGALANLVVNAIESAGTGAAVTLWAGAVSTAALQLRVRDNGPGVADDIADRIFDPFFTTRCEGTGLGLAVVARTVADHGGSIRLERPAHGGAEFVLELPTAAGVQHDAG